MKKVLFKKLSISDSSSLSRSLCRNVGHICGRKFQLGSRLGRRFEDFKGAKQCRFDYLYLYYIAFIDFYRTLLNIIGF